MRKVNQHCYVALNGSGLDDVNTLILGGQIINCRFLIDHMPPESMPMYGMFNMPPPPPSMPDFAPPSYDSHNFNHPPPTVSATVSTSAGHNHGIGFHDVEDDDFLPPAY